MGAYGYGLSYGLPTVLAKCEHNALNALTKRHLTAPPNPFRGAFHPSLLNHISTHIRPFFQTNRLQAQDTWKSGKTQTKLESIRISKMVDVCEFQKAKSFIKREVNPKIPTKARLIQGNKNEATAYFDPDTYKAIANSLSEIVYEVDGVAFELHYASHMNHSEIGERFTKEAHRPGNKVYDERDGKNWDSTMQEQHMRYEASVYALFDPTVAANHITRSTRACGTIRLKDAIIKYKTAWKRLSGDWNTSVGNTIVSMAILVSVIMQLPKDLRPDRVFGLFLGDDYLGVYNYGNRQVQRTALSQAMDAGEASMGITPVRAIFEDPLYCEFISLTCWPTYQGGYEFIPKISNILTKLFYSVHSPTKHLAADIQATITALRPRYRGLRFVERFFTQHAKAWPQRKTTKPLASPLMDRYTMLNLQGQETNINWAYGFAHKYRLPLTAFDFQHPCVTHAYLLRHPVVDRLFYLEHLDPCDREAVR